MIKTSILSILLVTVASFVIYTGKIPETDVFKKVFPNSTSNPSIMNVALSRKFDLAISIERMIPNAQSVKPDISFSAVDGSRPWSPAWQSPGLKNNSKQPNEPKKRLPTAYIEKYFE